MEKTIKIINELKKNRLIEEYAIGGGIATIFYVEPILTYDLDILLNILFVPLEEKREITTVLSIYEWFRKRGYNSHKGLIITEDIPVLFIPVYNKLVKEAVENAVEIRYEDAQTRILKPEYLIATMVDTFRPKDKERIIKILDKVEIDKLFLQNILQKFNLKEKFDRFMELYYGKKIEELFKSKEEFHKEQAKLPFEEKIKILVRLQKIANSIQKLSKKRQKIWNIF